MLLMPRSRTIAISSVVAMLAMGLALATAQEPARKPAAGAGSRGAAQATKTAPQPDPARMQQLLELWAAQSKKLTTLEVSIYRVDKDRAWDEEEHYIGHAAFVAPHSAYLDYRKVKLVLQPDPNDKKKQVLVPLKKNGKVEAPPFETVVCTGAEIWHYRYATKQIIVYTLDKDTRKKALEEGPLPFLFNMRAEEANRRYYMELRGEDATRYMVMVKPLLRDDQEVFSVAWLYLDRNYLLPTRIVLFSPDGKVQQDFRLSDFKANEKVNDRYFQVGAPGKPWKVERNPGRATQDAGNARKARRAAPPAQAAQRPADDESDQN
jgi:TIGR03009 family protein